MVFNLNLTNLPELFLLILDDGNVCISSVTLSLQERFQTKTEVVTVSFVNSLIHSAENRRGNLLFGKNSTKEVEHSMQLLRPTVTKTLSIVAYLCEVALWDNKLMSIK